MMKKLSLIIAALAMVLGITQCKKQENPVGGKLITQEVTFTTSFGDGSKLGVTETGGTLDLSWQVGDEIKVTDNAATPNVSTLECKSVSENGLTGTFKGTITCIEGAYLTFTVGSEPDYMNQHFTAITKDQIYLVGESDFEQSGNYEVDMTLPYAILKVDLTELATAEAAIVSVKIGDAVEPIANVTDVKTGACQVYLLLPLAATGQTTLKFTNTTSNKTITHTYSLAPNGFYTGGGNGGFAPIMKDYLCFTAQQANSSVQMIINRSDLNLHNLQYNINGNEWIDYTFNGLIGESISLANVGDKVYFRKAGEGVAESFSTSSAKFAYFKMTGKIAASGNVMSLIDPSCEATTIPCNYCFYKLFQNCSSLTAAPALPATTLANYCYSYMFQGCTSLTAAPALPATTLANNCYDAMFLGCTSLTEAPALPATTLANACYNNMFNGCTSLTEAPELPAKDLISNCYYGMFFNCSKLNYIKVHFTTWGQYTTNTWVGGVSSTGKFYCPSNLTEIYGNDNIPTGWAVNPPVNGQ